MDVIKKLQIKYIVSIVFILTFFFALVIGVINISTVRSNERMNKAVLSQMVENDGYRYGPFFLAAKKNSNVRMDFLFKIDTEKSEKMPFRDEVSDENFLRRTDRSGNDQLLKEKKENIDIFEVQPPSFENSSLSLRDYTFNFSMNEPFASDSVRNFFAVKLTPAGEIQELVSEYPVHLTDEEIEDLVSSVVKKSRNSGLYNGFRYLIGEKSYGFIAAFADTRSEANVQSRMWRISLRLYGLCLLITVFMAFLFSIWAVKPVKTAFFKQKRFVADASHELKTPLSVISANLDVLTSEIGENKWTGYIRDDVSRMSSLIKDLLYLAKTDAEGTKMQFSQFDLSRAVLSATLPFESSGFEKGMIIETDIAPNVSFVGDENRIKQIIIIFLDNALKYSAEGATITVKLVVNGNKKIVSVRNTGEGIPLKEQKRIFERFYRVDSSRNRETGGYGLGLSIAKTVAEAHHAKILLDSVEGQYTEFSLVL